MSIPSLKSIFRTSAAAVAVSPAAAVAAPVGAGLAVGSLHFAAPWVLAGLAALPPLLWLMRSIVHQPKRVDFPPMRILFGLANEDQKPERMPWWQYLLGTTIFTAAVVGLAQPEWKPETALDGDGPVMVVVDNGWASARNWSSRVAEMNTLVDRAEKGKRPVVIIPTAPGDDGGVKISGPMNAGEARGILKEMKPQPVSSDRQAALNAIQELPSDKGTSVVWLSDSLGDEAAIPLASRLKSMGDVTVLKDQGEAEPRLLVPPEATAEGLTLSVRRLNGAKEDTIRLSAGDESGHVISQKDVTFKAGVTETKVTFDLPAEIRSQLVRVTIDGDNSAGSVVLLDERWRRRPVGVISGNSGPSLLNEASYIEQAIVPFVDLHSGSADEVMKEKMSVIIMGDSTSVSDSVRSRLDLWAREGGTLLRFAGPNLATRNKTKDALLPVELRPGSRAVGGALGDAKAKRIAPFEKDSPFYGLRVPENITIERQVLARPDADNGVQTWARLEDGSPLVTAKQHGKGWIVLVHTTANREWSNLSLSGLFIDMLRAVVTHSEGVDKGPDGAAMSLPSIKTLDGFGQFRVPGSAVRPLTGEVIASGNVSIRNPPGFYGNESLRHAHNLASGVTALTPMPPMPDGVTVRHYDFGKGSADLSGLLLGGAMSLLLLDLMVLLGQRGALALPKTASGTGRKKPVSLDNRLHM